MAQVDFVNVGKTFDSGILAVDDFSLTVEEGEFLILVGPSGCGKTTLLRMVAGLEEVTSGEILIAGKSVNDLPPTERDVAMVFQNYALYPHMTVAQNLAFPLKQKKIRKAEITTRVLDVARLLGIEELLGRKPRELSGGQRQRVAIGRALVRRPVAFLMDEPLSNLDAKLRLQMRAELISLHKQLGITTIYVTHDQIEAMTLGDRVVVLNGGLAQQVDPPEQLYRHPANTFVAGFIGSPAMNFMHGRLDDGELDLGVIRIPLPDRLRRVLARQSGNVIIGVRPEDFQLDVGGGGGLDALVRIAEQLGPETLAHFSVDGLRIAHLGDRSAESEEARTNELSESLVARLDPNTDVRAGARVQLTPNAERLRLFDPESGDALFIGA